MSNQQIAIRGAKWTTTASAINTGISLLQLAILARLLDPAAFGLVSICTMIINFFQIFADSGFSNSIIYKQEGDRKVLSSLFYSSIGLGVVICALMNGGAFLVARFYGEPELVKLIAVASLVFPIETFGQIYWILLQKQLFFRTLALIEIMSVLLAAVCTIALAYQGYEAISLIYGQLLAATVRAIAYFLVGMRLFVPLLYFNLKRIKDHLVFGAYHIGQAVLGFFSGNLENIIVGKVIGVKDLGYYTIANQLAIFPIMKLNPIILQVTSPIMAKMEDDEGLRRAYLKITSFLSYCTYPLIFGLFITSDAVVPLIYGVGWEETASLIKILIFIGFLACLTAPSSSLILSKKRPEILFHISVISLLVKLPVLYIGAHFYGLTGIAVAYLISMAMSSALKLHYVHRLVGRIWKSVFHNIAKPLLYCAIMVTVIFAYQHFVGNGGILHTLAQVVIGGLVYVGLLLKYTISFNELKQLRKSL